VSNHARDGAQSRHNLIYWRYGDYIGIGPGAHGRITVGGEKLATVCYSNPQRWLDGVATQKSEKPRESLQRRDQANEFLLMGLRLKEGVRLDRYAQILGQPLPEDKIAHLENIDMLKRHKNQISVTNQGVMVLNAVLEELLVD
jgi:oxygen-independent coproporphyrinogen-3 oxidase